MPIRSAYKSVGPPRWSEMKVGGNRNDDREDEPGPRLEQRPAPKRRARGRVHAESSSTNASAWGHGP